MRRRPPSGWSADRRSVDVLVDPNTLPIAALAARRSTSPPPGTRTDNTSPVKSLSTDTVVAVAASSASIACVNCAPNKRVCDVRDRGAGEVRGTTTGDAGGVPADEEVRDDGAADGRAVGPLATGGADGRVVGCGTPRTAVGGVTGGLACAVAVLAVDGVAVVVLLSVATPSTITGDSSRALTPSSTSGPLDGRRNMADSRRLPRLNVLPRTSPAAMGVVVLPSPTSFGAAVVAAAAAAASGSAAADSSIAALSAPPKLLKRPRDAKEQATMTVSPTRMVKDSPSSSMSVMDAVASGTTWASARGVASSRYRRKRK
mmetsp:Transcript_7034/g.22525  ORF Transcript_7034/g.22525 Transcript_7034/m.22525 type:complete len:316 (-) Transcript_7034:1070-2017(-)